MRPLVAVAIGASAAMALAACGDTGEGVVIANGCGAELVVLAVPDSAPDQNDPRWVAGYLRGWGRELPDGAETEFVFSGIGDYPVLLAATSPDEAVSFLYLPASELPALIEVGGDLLSCPSS